MTAKLRTVVWSNFVNERLAAYVPDPVKREELIASIDGLLRFGPKFGQQVDGIWLIECAPRSGIPRLYVAYTFDDDEVLVKTVGIYLEA